MRNSLHKVTSIPEEPPGSVAGRKLAEGLASCMDSVAHVEKQRHDSETLGCCKWGTEWAHNAKTFLLTACVILQGTGLGAA